MATTDTTYGEPNLVVGPSGLSIFGDGSHSHTTDSINGGVTQAGFDVRPQTLSVNMFIYLGN